MARLPTDYLLQLRCSGGEVKLAQFRVPALQHQRLIVCIGAGVEAARGLPVQDIGLQSDLNIQLGGGAVDVEKFDVNHDGAGTLPSLVRVKPIRLNPHEVTKSRFFLNILERG